MNPRAASLPPPDADSSIRPPFPVPSPPRSGVGLGQRLAALVGRLSLPFWVAVGFTLIAMLLSVIGIGYAAYFHQNPEQAFSDGLSIALGFIASGAVGLYLLVDHYLATIAAVEGERHLAVERLRAVENSMLRGEGLAAVSSGIAHNFRNLFVPYHMGFEVIERQPLDAQARKLLGTMQKSLKHADRLIDEIMDYGQASGKPMAYAPLQLQALLNGYADILGPQLPPGIRLEVLASTDLPPVKANAEQVICCLQHLVFNAADAIEAGVGRITVVAERRVHHGRAYVGLTVTDTGVGIKPEVLSQMFTPFFTTKSRGRGTGMGLAIVRGIIRGHHGDIDIRSELGRGTSITLLFPPEAAAAAA